jgi:hypothetical protein
MARAPSKAGPRAAGAPRGAGVIWLVGLVCGAVIALATPYAVLSGAILVPGILVLLLDTGPGRPMAVPVLTIGAATLVQPMLALWAAGHQMRAALAIAGDPRSLAACWAWQGLGWLVLELGPPLIRLALDGAARARALRLRHQRAQIEEEWGIPPAEETGER